MTWHHATLRFTCNSEHCSCGLHSVYFEYTCLEKWEENNCAIMKCFFPPSSRWGKQNETKGLSCTLLPQPIGEWCKTECAGISVWVWFQSHTESALEDLKADSVVWTETDPVFDLVCVFAWEYFCNYAKSEQLQRVSSYKKSRKTVQMLEKHTCVLWQIYTF